MLVWLAGDLFIGWCAIFPIAALDTLTYYIRAANGDDVVRPYGPVGARFAVAEIAVVGTALLIAAVLLNRRQWHRLRAACLLNPMLFMAVTAALLTMPFLWFWFGTDRTF
ncbi:hypothetical protein [Actinoplanes couchii]|uniref:DUF2834 domain-containing protein n=1 Tax=Actinoplanes couchii TaxID=403638 RepID=A0ABQ3XLA6_9ACTN|nr:hypothetical protein [Actinoplanes couchii]MDR6318338.1 hypothetical protein [Actinoplanes couchii]GID59294.1 hypothetical protein Aco03nite_076980 [Actinoplanes couchii]